MRWGEIIRRLVLIPPTLVGVAVIVFVLLRVVPGDPIAMMIPPGATATDIERLRAFYGLDQPILFVELDELVRGARAVAVDLRLLDERIVDVAAQPFAAALGPGHNGAHSTSASARVTGQERNSRVIRITELALPLDYPPDALRTAVLKRLQIRDADLLECTLFKRSYDARKKHAIKFVCIVDVSVRDERSITGWLLGTFGYDGNVKGDTPWKRMVPLGLQWGNNPRVPYAETCAGPNGPCSQKKLTEQWINAKAAKELAAPPLHFNHLGYAGRLAGPVDNAKAACMGCHQTAGFPTVPILPEFSANGGLLKLDAVRRPETEQSFRMMYYGNAASGAVFSDTQLYSADYSLQLSMSLQNFISLRCRDNPGNQGAARPAMCEQLAQWAKAQRKSIGDLLTFGAPGPNGEPIKTPTDQYLSTCCAFDRRYRAAQPSCGCR